MNRLKGIFHSKLQSLGSCLMGERQEGSTAGFPISQIFLYHLVFFDVNPRTNRKILSMLKASVLCLASVLVGLCQLGILDTPGKRESPLRNRRYPIGP